MSGRFVDKGLTPIAPARRRGDGGAIQESILENGFYGAVVAQRSTGYVLAGNHRLKAAIEAGMDNVPVFWVDVDNDRALRILLADNRTNDIAGYDGDALARLPTELQESESGLLGTGHDSDALDELLKELGESDLPVKEDPGAELDKAEELQAKWKTERGQLWLIGEHRLLRGDSLNEDDVRRLMNDKRAQLFATDPPYLVGSTRRTTPAPSTIVGARRSQRPTSRARTRIGTAATASVGRGEHRLRALRRLHLRR